MKKCISVLLAFLLTASLTACLSIESSDPADGDDELSVETKATTDKDKLAVSVSDSNATGGSRQTGEPTNEDPATPTTSEDSSDPSVSINESLIVDQDGIRVTIKSLEYDKIFGYSLKVNIENNSSNDITLSIDNCSINGIMVSAYLGTNVAAGKKANDEITFSESDMELAQIEVIQQIEFVVHAYDSNTYDDITRSDVISITTSAESYVQKYDDQGVVALDDSNARIVIQRLTEKDIFGDYNLIVYIENKTKKELDIGIENVSVNGYMITTYLSCEDIAAEKKAFGTISISESDLSDNDIEKIESIELQFHLIDWENYDNTYNTEPITVTFE